MTKVGVSIGRGAARVRLLLRPGRGQPSGAAGRQPRPPAAAHRHRRRVLPPRGARPRRRRPPAHAQHRPPGTLDFDFFFNIMMSFLRVVMPY